MLIFWYNISMKRNRHIETLERMLRTGGMVTTVAARAQGIPGASVRHFAASRGLEKASAGVFLDPDELADPFAVLQARFPKAVFSHGAALYLHDMSEHEPIPLTVTVPSSYNATALRAEDVAVAYVKPEWHGLGVCEVVTPEQNVVRVYDKERTICDIVRRRSHMESAAFNYAIRSYVASDDKSLSRLGVYAQTLGIEDKLFDAIGVVL